MTDLEAKQVLDKIVTQVFGIKNPLSLDEFKNKFAFDVTMPVAVYDSVTSEQTWARNNTNNGNYRKLENILKETENKDLMYPKTEISNMTDILGVWQKINSTATEKYINSINVNKSDVIINCENVYMSLDMVGSKNVLFSDGGNNNQFIACCQRSHAMSYCIRIEGSQQISNSFEVVFSNKVTNSMFINNGYDLYECILCSHISGKQFCIANMQFTEEEYFKLKPMIINWIFNG